MESGAVVLLPKITDMELPTEVAALFEKPSKFSSLNLLSTNVSLPIQISSPSSTQQQATQHHITSRLRLKNGRKFEEWEDQMIIQLHKTYGNNWTLIAKRLTTRKRNSVKGRWYSVLRPIAEPESTTPKIEKATDSQ